MLFAFGLGAQGLPAGVDAYGWRGGWFTGAGAGAVSVYNGEWEGISGAVMRVFVGKALLPSLGGTVALDAFPYAFGDGTRNAWFIHGSLLWEPFVTAGYPDTPVSIVGRASAGCLVSQGAASPAAAAGLGLKIPVGPSSALILEAAGTVCSEKQILGTGRFLTLPALTLSLFQYID